MVYLKSQSKSDCCYLAGNLIKISIKMFRKTVWSSNKGPRHKWHCLNVSIRGDCSNWFTYYYKKFIYQFKLY